MDNEVKLRALALKADQLADLGERDGSIGWASVATILAELIKLLIPILCPPKE